MGVLLVQQPPPPIRIHGMFTDEEKGLINMDLKSQPVMKPDTDVHCGVLAPSSVALM